MSPSGKRSFRVRLHLITLISHYTILSHKKQRSRVLYFREDVPVLLPHYFNVSHYYMNRFLIELFCFFVTLVTNFFEINMV